MKILIKRLDKTLPVPKHARKGDAAVDLYCSEDLTVPAKGRYLAPTGVSLAFEEGYVGLIQDRSGLAAKNGITILAGVMDATYRGEYIVVMYNTTYSDFFVEKGTRIAQVVFQKHEVAEFEEVDELPESIRQEKGFGSSGDK